MTRAYPPAIIGIGRNYADHAKEMGGAVPTRPLVFMKNPACIIGDGETIVIPLICTEGGPQVDFEGELAVILDRDCRDVAEECALEMVRGYAVANDVSARWWQNEGAGSEEVTLLPFAKLMTSAETKMGAGRALGDSKLVSLLGTGVPVRIGGGKLSLSGVRASSARAAQGARLSRAIARILFIQKLNNKVRGFIIVGRTGGDGWINLEDGGFAGEGVGRIARQRGLSANGPKAKGKHRVKRLNKKVRKLGLKHALSSKVLDNKINILSDKDFKNFKTKDFSKFLSKINSKSALLIYDNENEVLLNNVKNIKNIKNIPEIGTNVYDILKYQNVLFTHSSIKKLQERLLK